ncbi:MAG: hypothetical protein LBR32_05265 [Propionibacteriaceae bacterium]|jgi:hypothetical protein|nr:hypothetical protein [Propionibacteriaceae bacterium]
MSSQDPTGPHDNNQAADSSTPQPGWGAAVPPVPPPGDSPRIAQDQPSAWASPAAPTPDGASPQAAYPAYGAAGTPSTPYPPAAGAPQAFAPGQPGYPYQPGQPYAAQQPYPAQQPYAQPNASGQLYAGQQPSQPYQPAYQPPAGSAPSAPAGYGYQAQPLAAATAQPAAKKKAPVVLIAVAVAAVVVVAAAAIAIPRLISAIAPDGGGLGPVPSVPTSAGSGQASEAPKPVAATPEAAVQAYYAALQAGDAATALSCGQTAPTDQTLLTDEVLKQAGAGITDVKVAAKEAYGDTYAAVTASYTIGGKRVSQQMGVQKVDDQWLLDSAVGTLRVGDGLSDAGLSVYGVALTQDGTYEAFPGVYEFAVSNPLLSLGDDSTVAVEFPEASGSVYGPLALSSDGQETLRKAAQAKLDACLKQKASQPKGCGFGVSDGSYKVKESTVKWKVKSGKIKASDFRLAYNDATTASASVSVILSVTAKSTSGASLSGSAFLFTISADISNPDDIVVSFGS